MDILSSEHNFLGYDGPDYDDSKIVIQQIPYEHTSSYGQGSSRGPASIIEASQYVEFYDEELDSELCFNHGIATLRPMDLGNKTDRDAVNLIRTETRAHLEQNKFVCSLGAEHTVSLGLFEAMRDNHPNVSILQIDAHSDLRESYEGNSHSHACVMARINDYSPKIAQVGIRAQSKEEAELIRNSPNILTYYAHQIDNIERMASNICNHLTDTVYITIDADGLDPSIVPGVGTPEPGGLDYHATLQLLRHICSTKTVVGFDIVECAPIEGQIHSQYVLAKLAYKVMGYCSLNPANFG